jgi:penicillin amidase
MTTDSAAAAIASTLLRHVIDDVFAEVGDDSEHFRAYRGFSEVAANSSFFGQITPAVLDLLDRRDDAWFPDRRTWDGVVEKALARTCRELERRLGPDPAAWAWGEVHTLELAHPLGAIPGLGKLLGRGPMALPGDTDTVWAGWQPAPGRAAPITTGPGIRFIADLADPDNTRIVLCGGQSGHPASGSYDDQLTDWLLGRTRRLHWSDEAIRASTVATLRLEG